MLIIFTNFRSINFINEKFNKNHSKKYNMFDLIYSYRLGARPLVLKEKHITCSNMITQFRNPIKHTIITNIRKKLRFKFT